MESYNNECSCGRPQGPRCRNNQDSCGQRLMRLDADWRAVFKEVAEAVGVPGETCPRKVVDAARKNCNSPGTCERCFYTRRACGCC